MKFVALLSGGKDSCYNLLHCRINGHLLVCAASLGPAHGKDELDSYMYQTVGQDAIELVAQALDVPLYRRIISGHAIEKGSEYGPRNNSSGVSGDETEDLYELLSTVKSHHPDVEAVSVGAILSNYQRVRVEHVCRRLSLTPLCYLWQRDQGELMSEMIAAGMESILIKVAGIGLTTKHLGRTLAQMEPTLVNLHDLYGAHICGEGGEYETLTLDCTLFKQRIILNEVETVIHSDNDFATVAFLRVKNASLQDKPTAVSEDCRIPDLLDEHAAAVRKRIDQSTGSRDVPQISIGASPSVSATPRSAQIGGWVCVANVVAEATRELSLDEEVRQCFRCLQDELAKHAVSLVDCVNLNVFLSSMELFASVNAVYATFFGTSPPARACVAVNLPKPHRVMLECTAHSKTSERHALHVQSLSYWAPANIGPYSQAVLANERVFISGQIGLIPSSLTLPVPSSLALEAALAGQHANRVAKALAVTTGGWEGHVQLAIYWLANGADLQRVKSTLGTIDTAPTLFLVVDALPKGALIEKQMILHTGRVSLVDEDGEPVIETRIPNFLFGGGDEQRWESSQIEEASAACATVCGRHGVELNATQIPSIPWSLVTAVRIFYVPSPIDGSCRAFQKLFSNSSPPATSIPCQLISSGGTEWDYALCIIT
ncbi:Diphthine--ammonia ligase [Mycena kentingensis (nom. inval.)]|nr:Diphthine--ammonia ligase [Mycena kentingensis (nom. inval.)]